jgi:hypothetical protein
VAKPWIDWLFLRGHVVPAKLAWRLDETPTAQGHSSNAKGPSCLLKATLIKYRRRHDVWKARGVCRMAPERLAVLPSRAAQPAGLPDITPSL